MIEKTSGQQAVYTAVFDEIRRTLDDDAIPAKERLDAVQTIITRYRFSTAPDIEKYGHMTFGFD